MKLSRVMRHLSASCCRPRAFDAALMARVGEAIADSERTHTGEIRFAVEDRLPLSYLWKNLSARARAQMVFSKLRVWDTEANNGVLIYVLLAERRVEIVADRGLARQVDAAQWEKIIELMRYHFRSGEFAAGALAGVQAVGAVLARYFPVRENQSNPNELSNQPIRL